MYQEKVRDVSSRSSVIWRLGCFRERAGMDGIGRGSLCIMRDWDKGLLNACMGLVAWVSKRNGEK